MVALDNHLTTNWYQKEQRQQLRYYKFLALLHVLFTQLDPLIDLPSPLPVARLLHVPMYCNRYRSDFNKFDKYISKLPSIVYWNICDDFFLHQRNNKIDHINTI